MALFVSLLCVIAGIWLLLQFAPQVYLSVLIEDADHVRGYLKVSVTLQNTSRARIGKHTVLLQGLAYGTEKALLLPENVPFRTSSVRSGEEPLEWHEPREIFKDLAYLFPGESVTSDCLVPLPEKAALVHVGVQFNASQGPVEALISRFFALNHSWESAAIFLADESA